MIEPSNSGTMIQGSNVHDRKRSSIIGSMGHNALKRKQRGSKEQSEFTSLFASSPVASTALRRRNCRVACCWHICRPQRLHESNEAGHFRGRQVFTEGWHIAAALNHLPDQLIAGETRGHAIQRGATEATLAPQAVTIPTL